MVIDGLKFKTKPWPHQLAALHFFMERGCGALYTDPGTGKSKVMIDLIINRGFKRVVVVATKKPCETWVKEFAIHATSDQIHVISLLSQTIEQRVSEVQKLQKGRTSEASERCTVIIVNYDVIWQDKLGDAIIKFKPDCVIADESHRFKAARGRWTGYMNRLGKATPHRYILSGTMIGEDPIDAYGQFRFMDPTIFGTNVTNMRRMYHNIDAHTSARVGFPVLNKKQPYQNLDDFNEKFWSATFRIPSSVKLPKRKNITYEFELSPKEVRAYELLRTEGAIDTRQGELLIENALTKVVRLQQAANSFIPLTNEDGKTKLYNTGDSRSAALYQLLEDFPKDEPVVVFAKFRKDIKAVRKVCAQLKLGCSEVSGKEDTEADWQAGRTSVIVLQYQSGSESIDLTKARYLIYYSLTHSYTQYYQSKKRIHRPHQNRMCIYYHLAALCKGKPTVDHAIIAALKRKQNLVHEIENGRAEL